MPFSIRRSRIPLVALCIVTASAALSLNCGSCEDNSEGGFDIDTGNLADSGADTRGPSTNSSYDEHTGIGYRTEAVESEKIDLLWVIDNSGSMCEEQRMLRNNFSRFVTQLTNQGVDFNMGVTTTQMDDYPLETLAEPGHIQSTPRPVPSPMPTCHGNEGASGDPTDGYQPIREAIDLAIACTKDPSQWASLSDATDEYIECQLVPGLERCSCNDDPYDNDVCNAQNLFPGGEGQASPYREIPKVLRSTEYDAVNKVDIERLSKDFACMSFVGTRGHSIEKGLGAAVKAVSPELTGGAVEDPEDISAPNHGLLREDAEFALVFLTDESDCTHDGTLDEGTACGDDICAFANHPDFPNSPLLDPSTLADDFMANLSASKGREISRDEITIASMHGQWKRYGEDASYPTGNAQMSMDACEQIPTPDIEEKPSCESPTGIANSGDRYERFARNFPKIFPQVGPGPNAHMDGLICQPDRIPDALEQIGETSAQIRPRCIFDDLYACSDGDNAADCPALRFGAGEPSCTPDGQQRAICDSAIELQLFAPSDTATPAVELDDTGYCLADSIGADGLERGCVVDRARYNLAACTDRGMRYEWADADEAQANLATFEVRVRFLTTEYEPQ
jgi:hypothetical protein